MITLYMKWHDYAPFPLSTPFWEFRGSIEKEARGDSIWGTFYSLLGVSLGSRVSTAWLLCLAFLLPFGSFNSQGSCKEHATC